MRILETKKDIDSFLKLLSRRAGGVSPEIIKSTGRIVNSVRSRGDRALREYTRKFDGHDKITLTQSEIERHAAKTPADIKKALKLAAGRINKFHMRQIERSWSIKESGISVGQIIRPLERVAVYVPGGKASYPSTVLMNVIPALVAGVKSIAITVPSPRGEINPCVMYAASMLGISEIHPIGGAQAVAAMAYGTETIRKADKIVGPGNIYVATAKKMVFGAVDIDMIAGPSEILVIADGSADPDFIAADLLSQAEHDELASSVLITTSSRVAGKTSASVDKMLAAAPRGAIAKKSIAKYGAIIVVDDLGEAASISNAVAPEHLEVMTKKPRHLLPELKNAGAIFLGHWCTEPLGDYAAGPNHTLPTGGTARWASPLGVYDFIKRTSLLEFSRSGFLSLANTVEKVAAIEGLHAHAEAVRVRMRKSRGL